MCGARLECAMRDTAMRAIRDAEHGRTDERLT
jgi:hypothetical protein